MSTIGVRRGKKTFQVTLENDIPAAMEELRKLSNRSDDELLIKAAVGACEGAASKLGGAPTAKKSGVLGAAYDPNKGGKTYKQRLFYALGAREGRRGTPKSIALKGEKGKFSGWNSRRSAVGYGKAGFLGARTHVARIAARKGIRVSRTRSTKLDVDSVSDADAVFLAIRKSITVVNSTGSAKAPRQNAGYQAAIERGLKIHLTKYLYNARKKYGEIARKVSAK